MRKELVICDKTYTNEDGNLEIDFGKLAQFEDMGIDVMSIGQKPIKEVIAYVSCVAEVSYKEASKLIREHGKQGGSYNDLVEAYAEALNESDFFQQLLMEAKSQTEKKKK